MTCYINIICNYKCSGWAVYDHLQRLVSVVGRTRGKLEDITLLRPRVRQRRPFTTTLSCSYNLRRDRGGTSKIQHSSVTKCRGPDTQPFHPSSTEEFGGDGCGSRATSRNAPGTSRSAVRQESSLGLPPSYSSSGAAAAACICLWQFLFYICQWLNFYICQWLKFYFNLSVTINILFILHLVYH